MRRLLAVIASLGVAGAALVLAFMLAVAGPGGCPTALLEGTLVEHGGTLAVQSAFDGTIVAVRWPFGYGVGEENGTLTLTRVFATVAREGDTVSMGGGDSGGVFAACGPVAVGLELPPVDAAPDPAPAKPTPTPLSGPATLEVTGTVYEHASCHRRAAGTGSPSRHRTCPSCGRG